MADVGCGTRQHWSLSAKWACTSLRVLISFAKGRRIWGKPLKHPHILLIKLKSAAKIAIRTMLIIYWNMFFWTYINCIEAFWLNLVLVWYFSLFINYNSKWNYSIWCISMIFWRFSFKNLLIIKIALFTLGDVQSRIWEVFGSNGCKWMLVLSHRQGQRPHCLRRLHPYHPRLHVSCYTLTAASMVGKGDFFPFIFPLEYFETLVTTLLLIVVPTERMSWP